MVAAIAPMRSTNATYSSRTPGLRRERNTVTIMALLHVLSPSCSVFRLAQPRRIAARGTIPRGDRYPTHRTNKYRGYDHGIDPNYCCTGAPVWRRRRILWSQARVLVTVALSE